MGPKPQTSENSVKRKFAEFTFGWITLGQIVVDPETGEEVEEFALYLCRRCRT
jgi:hypothetical protein